MHNTAYAIMLPISRTKHILTVTIYFEKLKFNYYESTRTIKFEY